MWNLFRDYLPPTVCTWLFFFVILLIFNRFTIKSPWSGVTCFHIASAPKGFCLLPVGFRKCAGWPLHDLDQSSQLWYWLTKICLHHQVRTTYPITTKLGSYIPLIKFWRNYAGIFSGFFFAWSNALLAIFYQWLGQLSWNKANLRDLIAATGLVILLKLNLNCRFFSPCDHEFWWMNPKNNRAPLLCYFKLFA